MKITVKLFMELERRFPDCYSDQNIEVGISEGSKGIDPLALLRTPTSPEATVIMCGKTGFLLLKVKRLNGSLICGDDNQPLLHYKQPVNMALIFCNSSTLRLPYLFSF